MQTPSPAERPALSRALAPTQSAAEYWKTMLADAPELLDLPTDHARPARRDHGGARVGVELDEGLSAGVDALSRRRGTTPDVTLLAAWAVVLGRLSGQADVVIGTPAAGRGESEAEGLIGSSDDTLPVRVDLSGAPTVAELLGRVKERVLDARRPPGHPLGAGDGAGAAGARRVAPPAVPGDVRVAERAPGRRARRSRMMRTRNPRT